MTPDPVATALRESEARYRLALHAGRMGSWETDFASGVRRWTEEGMALFGLDLPEGRGRVGGDADEFQASLHPDDRHLAADLRALADRQDSFLAEYRIFRPDGMRPLSPLALGLFWGLLICAILAFSGQASKFLYIDF